MQLQAHCQTLALEMVGVIRSVIHLKSQREVVLPPTETKNSWNALARSWSWSLTPLLTIFVAVWHIVKYWFRYLPNLSCVSLCRAKLVSKILLFYITEVFSEKYPLLLQFFEGLGGFTHYKRFKQLVPFSNKFEAFFINRSFPSFFACLKRLDWETLKVEFCEFFINNS